MGRHQAASFLKLVKMPKAAPFSTRACRPGRKRRGQWPEFELIVSLSHHTSPVFGIIAWFATASRRQSARLPPAAVLIGNVVAATRCGGDRTPRRRILRHPGVGDLRDNHRGRPRDFDHVERRQTRRRRGIRSTPWSCRAARLAGCALSSARFVSARRSSVSRAPTPSSRSRCRWRSWAWSCRLRRLRIREQTTQIVNGFRLGGLPCLDAAFPSSRPNWHRAYFLLVR